MPVTHCDPNGSPAAANELQVPNITTGSISTTPATTGVGNRRGLVISLHGLGVTPNPISLNPVSGEYGNFITNLTNDGWQVLSPPYPEDSYVKIGATGLFNDVNADSGHGSRYMTNTLSWWDHILLLCQASYLGWPIVVFGPSWGGWHALQVAAKKTSSLLAYGAMIPVTLLENLNPVISLSSANYMLTNSSGLDIPANMLNNVTIPGVIGYGTADIVAGYSGTTTVAAGSNGVAASAVTTLSVASNTGFITGGTDLTPGVTITGLTGGTGQATFTFSGTGTNTLTGATLISGSGTLSTGNPVVQSNTVALIAAQQAAQPAHQVTADPTGNNHLWLSTDTTFFTNWFTTVVDPLAPKMF